MKLLIIIVFVLSGCSLFQKEDSAPTFEDEIDIEDEYSDIGEDEYSDLPDIEPEPEPEPEPREAVLDDEPEEDTEEDVEEVEDVQFEVATIGNREGGHFAVLKSDCNVRWSPRGKKYHSLSKGKRLWVETSPDDTDWYTVYTRRSIAYMHKNCFKEE